MNNRGSQFGDVVADSFSKWPQFGIFDGQILEVELVSRTNLQNLGHSGICNGLFDTL